MKSVEIPDSVTDIGDYAFDECTGLDSVTIPGSTVIGYNIFCGCDDLNTIRYGVTFLQWCAMDNNRLGENAKHILLSDGIDVKAQEVIIPDGVTSIGAYAFYECTEMTSVKIPNSVESIERDAFYNCSSLTTVVIPDSVTSIGTNAFSECYELTSVEIPSSVESISPAAFCGCIKLASVEIPDSVKCIDNAVFSGCIGLTSVTIPVSVTYIEGDAFEDCDKLETVQYGGTKEDWEKIKFYESEGIASLNGKMITGSDGTTTWKHVDN